MDSHREKGEHGRAFLAAGSAGRINCPGVSGGPFKNADDVPDPASNPDEEEKHRTEERDVRQILSLLPENQQEGLLELWKEYNDNTTAEAKLVKALDKAETILQHNQGQNPARFDYGCNLGYGKQYFMDNPLLRALRQMLDEETAAHMDGGR